VIPRRRTALVAAAVVAVGFLVLAPRGAASAKQASPTAGLPRRAASARIDVLVMEGSGGLGGIDPAVRQFPQLARAPFSAYSQIRLVSQSTLALGSQAANVPLPGNGNAALSSGGMLPNGRYEVTVALTFSGRTHNLQFSATPGEPFFNVRATSPTAALVLAFVVR